MYATNACASSADLYDFRKDFDGIARPAMFRYLKHLDLEPDEPCGGLDNYWAAANDYATTLWKSLRWAQESLHAGRSPSLHPGITTWSRERAIEFTNTRLEWILAPAVEEPEEPIDVYEAVYLGTQMAREQGYACEPEAIAYAADRLKSKIERDAVENAEVCVHDGILTYYQWLKPKQERLGGGKVVYIDRYKQRREAREAERKQAEARFERWFAEWERAGRPQSEPQPGDDRGAQHGGKTREPMFKRIGALKAKPREWLIKGFLARNEVGNPFGRPDSFKGVSAAQLCVHIAGGVPFLGMDVKQMPAAYFAAERGEQAKRRIKGHIQRLGLPEDLPCYFGDRPVNLLDDADVKFLLEEITAMERDAGGPLGFLVIDTQSRTLDGDENSTKDGAKYAKAIELIRKRARAASLWIIAHSGHAEDAQDRPRGNSSLLGAYDTFYKHWKKDETHGGINITVDRDGLGQKVFFFTVGLYDTRATNEDGEPVLVPFIELDKGADNQRPFTFREPGADTGPVKTTDGEKEALRALTIAIQDHGLVTPEGEGIYASEGNEDIPPGEVTVSTEAWRTTFYKLDRERSPDAGRKAFNRALDGLIKKGLVGKYSDRFWPK
jgi:hypothetical protein